jgi:hypothetical protein
MSVPCFIFFAAVIAMLNSVSIHEEVSRRLFGRLDFINQVGNGLQLGALLYLLSGFVLNMYGYSCIV